MDPLTDCLRRVLDDVRARDGAGAEGAAKQEKPRKVFLAGASLGGFIWCVCCRPMGALVIVRAVRLTCNPSAPHLPPRPRQPQVPP